MAWAVGARGLVHLPPFSQTTTLMAAPPFAVFEEVGGTNLNPLPAPVPRDSPSSPSHFGTSPQNFPVPVLVRGTIK
jgi:hypothetical protein